MSGISIVINQFVSKSRSILTPLLREPGAILYSSALTLRKGEYYFLGLNPGGCAGQCIEESLNDLAGQRSNAYVDEQWENGRGKFPKGGHPLQSNAQDLFKALGSQIQDICSSNLIFSQSRGENDAGYPEKADLCWPVHELILDIVKPKTVITFGAKPFEYIANKLEAARMADHPSGHGGWVCREARTDGIRLIGLPHLSRYHLQGKQHVMSWILGE